MCTYSLSATTVAKKIRSANTCKLESVLCIYLYVLIQSPDYSSEGFIYLQLGHWGIDCVNNLCKVTTANETLGNSGTESLINIITYCPILENYPGFWSRFHVSSIYYLDKIYVSQKPEHFKRTWLYTISVNFTLSEYIFFLKISKQLNRNNIRVNGMFECKMSLLDSHVFFWWCLCLGGLFPFGARIPAGLMGCKLASCHWSSLLPEWRKPIISGFGCPRHSQCQPFPANMGYIFPNCELNQICPKHTSFEYFITALRKANNTIVSYSKPSFQF